MSKKFQVLHRGIAAALCAAAINAAALSLENVEFLTLANNGKLITLSYRSTSSDEAASKFIYGSRTTASFAFCKASGTEIECSSLRDGPVIRRYKIMPGDPLKHPEAKSIWSKHRSHRPIGSFVCYQGCETDRVKTLVEVSTGN
jgi:hypothetical protein